MKKELAAPLRENILEKPRPFYFRRASAFFRNSLPLFRLERRFGDARKKPWAMTLSVPKT
jgi:hypothetical protein